MRLKKCGICVEYVLFEPVKSVKNKGFSMGNNPMVGDTVAVAESRK